MKDKDFAREICERMNELLEYNEEVRADITAFYNQTLEARPGTVCHPTLQVQLGTNHLSFLGLLNGMAGKVTSAGPLKGCGLISARWDEKGLVDFYLTEDAYE